MNIAKKNIDGIMAAAYCQAGRLLRRLARQSLLSVLLLTAGLSAALANEVGRVIQATGSASIDGQPAQVGAVVHQAQHLITGADGYLYVQTVDKGYVILRPNSSLHIPTYRIDAQDPSKSQFKMELQKGVVRSISGEAIPAARHHFRLNTPIAAIGVLGTDFTVFTDEDITRVAVAQGGVVVSAWGDACQADGIGPCHTANGLQLLANQIGQIVQVQRGVQMPQILEDAALAPEAAAPAQADEPASKPPAGQALDAASDTMQPLKASLLEPAKLLHPGHMPAASDIQWGRWSELAKADGSFSLAEAKLRKELVGLNSYFAVLRAKDSSWLTPQQSSLSFRLQDAQALVMSSDGVQAASVANGRLHIDFGASSFATGFDLVTERGERFERRAQGMIARDGKFDSSVIMGGSNMVLQGTVAPLKGSDALDAAYLFQTRLDDDRTATGATYWKSWP